MKNHSSYGKVICQDVKQNKQQTKINYPIKLHQLSHVSIQVKSDEKWTASALWKEVKISLLLYI